MNVNFEQKLNELYCLGEISRYSPRQQLENCSLLFLTKMPNTAFFNGLWEEKLVTGRGSC
jgi:hypothetical protein